MLSSRPRLVLSRGREGFRYYYPVVDPINDCVYNSGNGQGRSWNREASRLMGLLTRFDREKVAPIGFSSRRENFVWPTGILIRELFCREFLLLLEALRRGLFVEINSLPASTVAGHNELI